MKTAKGFTLIEVMIVVAIVTILAMIGYPAYKNQVASARRSAAKILLMELSNREAQYLSYTRQYASNFDSTGLNFTTTANDMGWSCAVTSCENNNYTVTGVVDNNAAPPTFTLTAQPKSTGMNNGEASLTIDQTGLKGGPWQK